MWRCVPIGQLRLSECPAKPAFLWSEGFQCIVTFLHPRAQSSLRNCDIKDTGERKSYVVERVSHHVGPLKNFRLFGLRKQRAGLRVMLQKQHMAVKCEYYSEDPSARCMLAPNWALEKHLPGLTEICLISLAHWQMINRTDLKRFLVSYCTSLYNICRLNLSGEVKCRCKNLAQFWKVWTFFENVSFIFWYAIDFPSSRAAE